MSKTAKLCRAFRLSTTANGFVRLLPFGVWARWREAFGNWKNESKNWNKDSRTFRSRTLRYLRDNLLSDCRTADYFVRLPELLPVIESGFNFSYLLYSVFISLVRNDISYYFVKNLAHFGNKSADRICRRRKFLDKFT